MRYSVSFACVLAIGVAPLVACSESAGGGGGGGTDGAGGTGGNGVAECTSKQDAPWLKTGNFWNVAWSEIDIAIGLFEAGGDYDLGTYVMKLGESSTVDGVTMYPLELSGDVTKYAPFWTSVGTDGCRIYGAKAGGSPVPIYNLTGNEWTGRGFWTSFEGFSNITVDRNATIVPSQYTQKLDIFEPPLTSVGFSDSESGIGAGTGCDYFPGVGTICGSDDPGGSRRELIYEYWDEDAGPAAFHYSYDYDTGGSLSTEKHAEQRVEVWFYGDTSSAPIVFENEPDNYAEPTPFPVSRELLVMFAEISNFDFPSGTISGYTPPMYATDVHDWFEFEIAQQDVGRTVEFYLAWDHDIDLDFHLYASPDNTTYGFTYLASAQDFPSWTETKYALLFSGTYSAAGQYLLGVTRPQPNEISTQYGIFSIIDPN